MQPSDNTLDHFEPTPVGAFGNRRVLVVDDNASIHDDYRKVLAPAPSTDGALAELETELFGESATGPGLERFDVCFAFQGADALQLVARAKEESLPYAVVFLDIRMPPGWDGIETAQRLWEADPDLLIVICSAHSDYSWGELVEQLGRSDRWLVLKKPFDPVEVRQLALAMTEKWETTKQNDQYAVSLERMVEERTQALHGEMAKLREAQREVSYLAQHDTLTTLPNRRFLETHLGHQVRLARLHGRGLAVMSVDLDRFKWINDTLGHAAGDLVLKTVAARLRASLSDGDCVVRSSVPPPDETDTVARLGGDEFVVLLTDIESRDDAAVVGRKIVEQMAVPINIDGHDISVGASLGIAIQPADGDNPEVLLHKADLAMYSAKASGRDKFCFYTDDLHKGDDNRLWLENEMRKALEQGSFSLAFQPEVDAEHRVVVGAEALLRWNHPQRGFISPDKFIPVAEETGLIIQLGAWVLEEACKQAVVAVREISTFRRIAVNVSATQLRDDRFVGMVQSTLQKWGLRACQLELEITEGAFIEQAKVDRNLRRLRELGVNVALDDFGTGYSSLAHLAHWPIDTVKIDRSFVLDLPNNPKSLGIVRCIMALARCFAGRVVGEGVEEARQRDALVAEGCTVLQGYMFCKPVPFEQFLKWSLQANSALASTHSFGRFSTNTQQPTQQGAE